MIFQHLALLSGMPFISVIGTVQVLVSLGWVSLHLVQLSDVWFILNPVYDLVHWFLECHIHLPHLYFQLLHSQILLGSWWKNTLPRTIYQWSFAFAL